MQFSKRLDRFGEEIFAALNNRRMELEQQGLLYTPTDPQNVLSGRVEGTGRLYVELTIQELYPDTAYACMHLLNRVRAAERLTNSMPFKFLKKLKNILKSR